MQFLVTIPRGRRRGIQDRTNGRLLYFDLRNVERDREVISQGDFLSVLRMPRSRVTNPVIRFNSEEATAYPLVQGAIWRRNFERFYIDHSPTGGYPLVESGSINPWLYLFVGNGQELIPAPDMGVGNYELIARSITLIAPTTQVILPGTGIVQPGGHLEDFGSVRVSLSLLNHGPSPIEIETASSVVSGDRLRLNGDDSLSIETDSIDAIIVHTLGSSTFQWLMTR